MFFSLDSRCLILRYNGEDPGGRQILPPAGSGAEGVVRERVAALRRGTGILLPGT